MEGDFFEKKLIKQKRENNLEAKKKRKLVKGAVRLGAWIGRIVMAF